MNDGAKAEGFDLAKPLTYVAFDGLRIGAVVVTALLIGWAIWQSKRENTARNEMDSIEVDVPEKVGAK